MLVFLVAWWCVRRELACGCFRSSDGLSQLVEVLTASSDAIGPSITIVAREKWRIKYCRVVLMEFSSKSRHWYPSTIFRQLMERFLHSLSLFFLCSLPFFSMCVVCVYHVEGWGTWMGGWWGVKKVKGWGNIVWWGCYFFLFSCRGIIKLDECAW